MGISSKLCNPTPFQVKYRWEPGINIVIEPDGFTELSHAQMLDFRSGLPGSAEVRQETDYLGIFLLDPDRNYDIQALEAIKRSVQAKSEEYRTRMQNLRSQRTASGMKPDEETMDELERQAGLDTLNAQIQALKAREKYLTSAVTESVEKKKQEIDFTRTCLATTPPREFASPIALNLYLEEHPEIKAKHQELVSAMQEA